jgi:3-hydroxypropanoate dehydrogenase
MPLPVLSDSALDQLFRAARTQNGWLPIPVTETQLRAIHDLVKWGPTSANQQPLRVKFLTSAAAKAKLEPHLSAGNREKTMAAPAVALLGYDLEFYEHLPRMFPHAPTAKSWFTGSEESIRANAFRNGTLQAGYFILAARAVGLDCGPMSGFDATGVDAAFWAGTQVKTNIICNLGHGDPAKLFPRSPRFEFDEICQVL